MSHAPPKSVRPAWLMEVMQRKGLSAASLALAANPQNGINCRPNGSAVSPPGPTLDQINRRAQIPLKFMQDPRASDHPWWEAAQKAHDLLQLGGIACLHGACGVGKTHLACRAIRTLWSERKGRYETALSIARTVQQTFRPDAVETEHDVVTRFARLEMLVIDDWHLLKQSAFDHRVFSDLIDTRYANERPTLIVLNADSSEIAAMLGPQIVSRLKELGRVFHCEWPSFRSHPSTGGT